MAYALEGIRVLDVSALAAGPMGARHLADFGADVIHVENPAGGDIYRESAARWRSATGSALPSINWVWENYNRNKRSLAVDLSQKCGQEIIHKLVEKADVFLTNTRPFQLEKFRLDYDTLSQLNPRLIYASLTGSGKNGPEANVPGYDFSSYWARSGIAHMAKIPGHPPTTPPSGAFGDNVAGLILFTGVMTALFVRERTGVGQELDVSLFHTGIYQLSQYICGALVGGRDYEEAVLASKKEAGPNPLTRLYETKDGRWLLFILMQPDRYWSRFCQAIEREDLEHDPKFASTEARTQNKVALIHILEEVFRTKTVDEWKPRLKWLPFDLVQTLTEVVNDPQARANEVFTAFDHSVYGRIEEVSNPIKLSKTPATIRTAAPEFGQHTEEILLEIGYTWEDIKQFKEQAVVP